MTDRKFGSALNPRKAAVLRAVVQEYVRTGEPVGSETVAERYEFGVSPATIRNEMSALEDLGYLSHPHTSAGRTPTDLGYRRYVDSLPSPGRLREAQRRAIATFFRQTAQDMEAVLAGATRLLSRLTQYAGLAIPPPVAEEPLLRVEIVEIGSAGLLVLAIGQQGRVHKAQVERPPGLGAEGLRSLESRLGLLAGVPLRDAAGRLREIAREGPPEERDTLAAVAQALEDVRERAEAGHVLVGGVGNLALEVATWRRDTVRRLFEALERESEVLRVLHAIRPGEEFAVTIGAEHPATERWDASVVAAPYRLGEEPLGTIGIVGPTRMDYEGTIAAVRAVARRLSELAAELGG